MKPVLQRLAWLTAILYAACGHQPARSNAVLVILIDRSESVDKPEMRRLYGRSLKTLLQSIRLGDALEVGWITDREELELAVDTTLPSPGALSNPLIAKAESIRADSDLAKIADSLEHLLALQPRKIRHTAIVQSVGLASRVFATHDGAHQILVIMSDMVEQSGDIDFRREYPTPPRIDAIITKLRTEHRIPSLRGVRIHVLGAASGNNELDRHVRDFWFAFFDSTGAELRASDYGAALVGFEVPH
jgi:hypothetical protein